MMFKNSGLVSMLPGKLVMSRVFLFVIALILPLHGIADERPSRVGYAHDVVDNTLLYSEHHYETLEDKLVKKSRVEYRDTNGEIFAEKKVDFESNPYLPEFFLLNDATGHLESTAYLDNKYKVRFVEKVNDKLKEKALTYSSDAISDAGFDNFIISHWQEIIEGKQFTREFLIPGMLRFFKFRIYQDELVENEDGKFRILVIEPNSFLIRAFTRANRLHYAFDKPELKRFEGISNMRDAQGKNYTVLINYENSPELLTAND